MTRTSDQNIARHENRLLADYLTEKWRCQVCERGVEEGVHICESCMEGHTCEKCGEYSRDELSRLRDLSVCQKCWEIEEEAGRL